LTHRNLEKNGVRRRTRDADSKQMKSSKKKAEAMGTWKGGEKEDPRSVTLFARAGQERGQGKGTWTQFVQDEGEETLGKKKKMQLGTEENRLSEGIKVPGGEKACTETSSKNAHTGGVARIAQQ